MKNFSNLDEFKKFKGFIISNEESVKVYIFLIKFIQKLSLNKKKLPDF